MAPTQLAVCQSIKYSVYETVPILTKVLTGNFWLLLLYLGSGAHPEFTLGGGGEGADPEAVCNLCLILKIVIKIML
jgi:hypothetical protein